MKKKSNILRKDNGSLYRITDHIEILPIVFLFALLHYRDHFFPNASGLDIETVKTEENSPGHVFFLAGYQVDSMMNELHDQGLVRIETFGDLDQVRFSMDLTKEKVLNKIYGIE